MLTNNIIVRNPSNYVLIREYSPVADMMLLNWNPKFLFAKLTSDSAYLLQD